MTNINLTEPQDQIAKDKHRFRVVCCGRRFGKTTLAVWEIMSMAALRSGSRIAYIAPTYQQARDIAWDEIKNLSEGIAYQINESRLEIILKNKSHIYLRGWESVETLRGQAFDFLVVDEIAMMRNWEYNWHEVLRPTLTDKEGTALFISTPKGFNHFYDLYNKEGSDKDYKSYHFRSEDNPHLPSQELGKARKELSESAYAQEYEAEFRTSIGLAHKEWDREIHLIDPFEPRDDWQYARGFDYGATHATARVRVVVFQEGKETTWFIDRCYKQSDMAIEEHATAIKTQDYGKGFMPSFGDPSGAQWFKEFAHYGLSISPASKQGSAASWLELGVEKINQLLKRRQGYTLHLPDGRAINDAPKLFVLKSDENMEIVREFETLQWKTSKDGQMFSSLDESGGHFDLLAAFRYLVVSYRGMARRRSQIAKQDLFDSYGNPKV